MKANGTIDRIVTDISIAPGFNPATPPTPFPTFVATKALWDTGASKSVISTTLVKSLGLTPVGAIQVHHGDGTSTRNTYLVNFTLPNSVSVAGVLATEFPPSHDHFAVLVGMDVITLGDFLITNVGGITWVSFRIPSCETIDYVAQANRLRFAGVTRNAPCPCGSGRKFKNCHGAN